MTDSIGEFFASADKAALVHDPFKFKAKLKIGSKAFGFLSKAENLKEALNVAGSGALGAAAVGASWYSGLGTLGTLGMSLGLVSTPVGWIAAAGLGGGAAMYGLNRLIKDQRKDSIEEVPKYINTPLDILAANIMEVLLPPLIHVANSDGHFHHLEREKIISHFSDDWGLSRDQVATKCHEFNEQESDFDLASWSESMRALGESADIDFDALRKDLVETLAELASADGQLDASEEQALQGISAAMADAPSRLSSSIDSLQKTAGDAVTKIYESSLYEWIADIFSASDSDVPDEVENTLNERLPTLWLLGKTGAGKSSFIKQLSGYAHVPIGTGFMPCTQTLDEYLFPEKSPILKLLDTRGLGEAGYDPDDDIEVAGRQSDLIVAVAKIDEPNQADILNVLRRSKRFGISSDLLVLHTGASKGREETQRLVSYQIAQFDDAWKGQIHHVRVDLFDPTHPGHVEIENQLSYLLPVVALMIQQDQEAEKLSVELKSLRPSIYRYASISAASGAIPVIGSVSTLAAQGLLLKDIATYFDLEWNEELLKELLSALGVGFIATQLASILGRSALSTVPIAGSVTSGVISFATTYALGHVATLYFGKKARGEIPSEEELQKVFKESFAYGKHANANI